MSRTSKEVSQDMIQLKDECDGLTIFQKMDVLLAVTQVCNDLTRDIIQDTEG